MIAGSDQKRTSEALAAHADALIGRPEAMQRIDVPDEERVQMAPLFELAGQLKRSMPPVQPATAFVRSLGKELARTAKHQLAATRRMRRGVLIGAATVGSLVSIASVVGAIIFVVSRQRARSHVQTL
jgi:hypothetical protein